MLKKKEISGSQPSVVPLRFDNWVRAANCSVEGAHVVAKGHVVWYSPALVKDLVGDFGRIGDATGAVRFVSEFGPLELPGAVSRAKLITGVEEFEWRESVASILVQAKKVARIRKSGALLTDTRPKIQKNLASILVDLWGLKMPFAPDPKAAANDLSTARVKHVVSEFTLQELNEQLPRSWERAHINVAGEFEGVLSFESLLAVIYRKLFEELERGRLRLCLECGSVFEWTDSRQMYCGKRCGLNLAQRQYRKRQTKQGHD